MRKKPDMREREDRKQVRELMRRCDKACDFPNNTDPASRHVRLMAEGLLSKRGYPMLQEEPAHCAISLLATVAMLWEARNELEDLRITDEGYWP